MKYSAETGLLPFAIIFAFEVPFLVKLHMKLVISVERTEHWNSTLLDSVVVRLLGTMTTSNPVWSL